jgi:hypothetical protein
MRRFLIGVAIATIVVTGCGSGGSDKTTSATKTAPAGAQGANAYQAQVTKLIHEVVAADKPLDSAKTKADVVALAPALEKQWLAIAAKLDALNARPSVKKYQDQIVAVLRRGARQIQDELKQPHPNAAKINRIFGRAVPSLGPIISSLYAAP